MKEEVKVLEFDGDVTASINLTAQETIMLTCLIGERINKSEANKENHDTWDCLHKKLKKFFKEEISTQFKEKKTNNWIYQKEQKMAKIHTLKILETYADAVYSGDKNFEIRDNSDRGFQKGDSVIFKVIDNLKLEIPTHPLNEKEYEITYVLNGWGLKENWVVFGIKRKESDN